MDIRIAVVDAPSSADAASVGAIIDAAREADGVEPVSEQGRIVLREGRARAGVRHLAARYRDGDGDGDVVGYAQVDSGEDGEPPAAELVVHPDRRRRGVGGALLEAVREEVGGPVRVWAHGALPGARGLAGRAGLRVVRELRQMRRPLGAADGGVSAEPLPEGVRVRTFVVGQDEDAWLKLNAAAFAHHPEQGSLTAGDLAARIAEPWFDADGFFLAERDAGAVAGGAADGSAADGARLVGFHWTKVHQRENLGEVYVVGVDPAEQGNGLGRALTDIGVRHLAAQGLPGVLLYVDADNTAAVRVYERLGFTVHELDLMYLS